ncbi:MAG: DUF177 domain-containing protein [Desulfobacteraceae bacterium]|nr:MAG: DUF177 domain-containing protein [Desulfobacteraceae bacterium]
MKIDLTNIPSGSKEISFSLKPDWWKTDFNEDRIVGFESPLSTWFKIYPAGEKIVVDGFLSVRLFLRCDRCLETYTQDLSADFRIYLSMFPFKGEADVELLEDDLSLDFIDGNFLDSDQIIKEQLILNLPMKTLCTKDCKGLCPICGCNLNTAMCSCQSRYETFGNVH